MRNDRDVMVNFEPGEYTKWTQALFRDACVTDITYVY